MFLKHSVATIAAILFLTPVAAVADARLFEDVIRVTASKEPTTASLLILEHPGHLAPDAASLVGRLAGAALVNNGPLSGQLQNRGVFGERVAISVNGQRFHSGGPNMMDPPLSYAPSVLIDRIDVSRGAPGTEVASSLMGGVNVLLKTVSFGMDHRWVPQYNVTLTAREIDSSHGVGGVAGIANDRFRVFTLFADESGNDSEWRGGTIAGTSFERRVAGLGAGYRGDDSYVDVELRRQETGPTGNPPFAMDIEYIETDFARVAFGTKVIGWALDGALGLTDVNHGMNNYSLRPAPPTPMRDRRTVTGAKTVFGSLVGTLERDHGRLEIGIDGEQADKAARITNPNNAGFYLNTLTDVDVARVGLFAAWTGQAGRVHMTLGGRVDRHDASAGDAFVGPMVPMGPTMLAGAFNQQARDWSDTTADASLRLWWRAGDVTWRSSLSRKSRAPGYVERFAWLPTPASGGLADGNTWVGDVELDVEVANTFDFGFDLRTDRALIRPTVFYSRVDDFVQGLPVDDTPTAVDSMVEMVSSMNGDPSPLRFSNVDARLYGVELDFDYRVTDRIYVDGMWTWVRGDRRDLDEPLYRMTPSRLMAGLSWGTADYGVRAEAIHEAAQNRVSIVNSEATTSSNTVINLHGHWRATTRVDLAFGIQNAFDREFSRHLAGYNRHADSDVAPGERLPGEGRAVYFRVNFRTGS